jgi:hypothetical protein
VALSVVPDEGLVRRWARQHGLTEPIAVATGNVLTPLGVQGVPSAVLVDRDRVVAVAPDGADAAQIGAALAAR